MNLSPYIYTDVKMPKKMFPAPPRHEVICCATGQDVVTVESVREFSRKEYGETFADGFRPEYLFKSPKT